MKVLDRYIMRELLSPIFYLSSVLVFLILIADLFDNLDQLLRNDTPFVVILQYYGSLIPHSFIQILPWATWLGTVYLLVNFGFHSETIAMKAAGLKITAIVKPILFTGFLIGIATFLINDRVVPATYKKASDLREIYIEKNKDAIEEKDLHNVTYYAKGDKLYYFQTLSTRDNTVEGIVMLTSEGFRGNKRKKVIGQKGKWENGLWEFEKVTEYQMDSRGQVLGEPKMFDSKAYENIKFTPDDLAASSSASMFLTHKELKKWIEKLKDNGVRVHSERVDLHNRLSSPWQGFVMMLITIPLLARTAQRKTIALSVLICVGLVFVFHITGAVGIALGKAGKLFPIASAWAGNFLFLAGSLFYIEKANY